MSKMEDREAASTVATNEDFWRRDEVVYLLHAWRDVAADRVGSNATLRIDDPTRYQLRIFERFCGFYEDPNSDSSTPRSLPRSFKSLMKTKKSLLRAFRFIAVFNANHVIARSMSAMGGRNWFSLPDDEQRRIVAAHYKRKPFAYIDEDMFDAIEMIQEMETQQPDDDNDNNDNVDQQRLQQQHRATSRSAGKHESATTKPRNTMGRFSRSANPRTERMSHATVTTEPLPMNRRDADNNTTAAATSSSRTGSSWMREDHVALLQAWQTVFHESRIADEPTAVLDDRIYQRFQALSNGTNTQRSPIAVRLKRYSLLSSFEFIRDYDRGAFGNDNGTSWFDTTRKDRNAVVQQHYRKSHFTHIDADMVDVLADIVAMTKSATDADAAGTARPKHEAASTVGNTVGATVGDTAMAEAEDYYVNNDDAAFDMRAREPWGRHETSLLLSAWSHAEALAQQTPNAIRDLDAFIYRRFCTNCGGESVRDSVDVLARKRVLEHTFELIASFDIDVSKLRAAGDVEAPANWFALRKGERNRLLRDAPKLCVDIDESAYNELRWIFQVRKQAALLSTLSSTPVVLPPPRIPTPTPSSNEPAGGQGQNYPIRAVTVWSRDEVLHLLEAWTDILTGPCDATESLAALNDRIYKRYLALAGNTATPRSVKALHAKRDSVVASYHFIQDFNRGTMVAPVGTTTETTWRTGSDWFALSHDEQRLVVKTFYRKASFSYLYSDMMAAIAAIIAKSPTGMTPTTSSVKSLATTTPLTTSSASTKTSAWTTSSAVSTATVGFGLRKPRPNSWTPDELRSFLRAWYELTCEEPRDANETATAFNGRLHRRFLQLCSGRSKKAETSLLTKRRVLTTTYAFITEFNAQAHVNDAGAIVPGDWFRLDDIERRKRTILVNRSVHTVTPIDEETYFALDRILGDGTKQMQHNSSSMLDSSSSSSSRQQPSHYDDTADSPGIASPTATLYDSVRELIGVKRKASALDTTESVKRQKTTAAADGLATRSVSVTSPTATLYDSVRVFIGAVQPISARLPTAPPAGADRHVRAKIETRARRREVLAATELASRRASSSVDSNPFRARAKQLRVGDMHTIDSIASMLDRQTQHLASIVDEIRSERQTEQTERRKLLDAILDDQREERRLRREEQMRERNLANERWDEFRAERRADREHERLVLEHLTSLHAAFAKLCDDSN